MAEKSVLLKIEGMTCDGCAETVKRYLKQAEGVTNVSVDWGSGRGEVDFDPTRTDEEQILMSRAFRRQYRASRLED